MQTYSVPYVLGDVVKFSERSSVKFKVIGIELRENSTVWYFLFNLDTGRRYSFWVVSDELIKA